MDFISSKEIWQDLRYNKTMQNIEIGKIYCHYKGNRYKVLGVGKHSETLEEMVVYQSLKNGEIWVRPAKMWNEVVDDKNTLRFTQE